MSIFDDLNEHTAYVEVLTSSADFQRVYQRTESIGAIKDDVLESISPALAREPENWILEYSGVTLNDTELLDMVLNRFGLDQYITLNLTMCGAAI